MKDSSLRVPAEESRTISINRSEYCGGRLAHLRPRTPQALKTVAGVRVSEPSRLDDPDAFDLIDDRERIEDMLELRFDRAAGIGELSPAQFTAIAARLPEKGQIPRAVRVQQRVRQDRQFGRRGLLLDGNGGQNLEELGRIVREIDLLLPDWLADLEVVVPIIVYDDIVVEESGTLIIDGSVSWMWANNIYLYSEATVVQQAPHLHVAASGEVKGGAQLS